MVSSTQALNSSHETGLPGVVQVMDFGLSKTLVPVEKHGTLDPNLHQVYRLTGETGSYRYMAPEVFRHEPYNQNVDVYSFAMIIFQLFETSVPFAGGRWQLCF